MHRWGGAAEGGRQVRQLGRQPVPCFSLARAMTRSSCCLAAASADLPRGRGRAAAEAEQPASHGSLGWLSEVEQARKEP